MMDIKAKRISGTWYEIICSDRDTGNKFLFKVECIGSYASPLGATSREIYKKLSPSEQLAIPFAVGTV